MNEVRLIDANALKEDLRRYFTDGVLDGVSAKLAFNQILHDIDNAPSVEPERPKGEWENDSDNLPICNKCGEIALQRIFVKMPHLIQDVRMVRSNYCPNCGADMRKGGAE